MEVWQWYSRARPLNKTERRCTRNKNMAAFLLGSYQFFETILGRWVVEEKFREIFYRPSLAFNESWRNCLLGPGK
jgi:hypothetical protein